MKERNSSSLQAIKKYVLANYQVDAEKLSPFIKKYLKAVVVILCKRKERVPADAKPEAKFLTKKSYAIGKAKAAFEKKTMAVNASYL